MAIVTTALVLHRVKLGEADQILTLLSPELGVVSASARGSLRLKNKLFHGCGLFCYTEFTLASGRTQYFVESAEVQRVFHGLSASIEAMGVAQYLAEVATRLAPAPPDAAPQLRLLLNCLHLLAEQKRPPRQIKAIYELRALSLSGYQPDLLACASCGRYEGGAFYFDVQEGHLLCGDCAQNANRRPNLDPGALHALRHICLVEDARLFAFQLKPQSLQLLSKAAESYLLAHLEEQPKSLGFVRTVLE